MANSPTPTITFIGGGNMAQALIGGLIRSGTPAGNVRVADPSEQQRRSLASTFGVATFEDNAAAAHGSDTIVLAVKPQVMPEALESLGDRLDGEVLVISVAAGITLQGLSEGLDGHGRIVRAMPNTPALYGAGITGLVAASGVSDSQRRQAESILGTAGKVVWVEDEALMDVVTAVSGSGPAYFFRLVEALALAGTRAGLDEQDAARLARQTAFGAGTMLTESGLDAGELRERVTSPGGTTAAALETLEAGGLEQLIDDAVQAAVARGRELGQS